MEMWACFCDKLLHEADARIHQNVVDWFLCSIYYPCWKEDASYACRLAYPHFLYKKLLTLDLANANLRECIYSYKQVRHVFLEKIFMLNTPKEKKKEKKSLWMIKIFCFASSISGHGLSSNHCKTFQAICGFEISRRLKSYITKRNNSVMHKMAFSPSERCCVTNFQQFQMIDLDRPQDHTSRDLCPLGIWHCFFNISRIKANDFSIHNLGRCVYIEQFFFVFRRDWHQERK